MSKFIEKENEKICPINMKTFLKEKFNLPESMFGSHETDLYVEYRPDIYEYLKRNYEFPQNISMFFSCNYQKNMIDIPFAAERKTFKNGTI